MRLLITHRCTSGSTDLAIDFDATATVSALRRVLIDEGLADSAPLADSHGMIVESPGSTREIGPDQPLTAAGIPDGAVLRLAGGRRPIHDLSAPRLLALTGPHAGRSFPLLAGVNLIGRREPADIQIPDPAISRVHVRVTVDARSTVEIADLNSANGTLLDGSSISRSRLRTGQRITLGDTELRLEPPAGGAAPPDGPSGQVQFLRSPRLTPGFDQEEYPAPELPDRPRPPHFPLTMLALPLLLGAVLYAATGRLSSLVFVALMPMMMIGMWFENRRRVRSETETAWTSFRADITRLGEILSHRQERERLVRQEEHPSVERLVTAINRRTSLLWSRRPDRPGFLELRLGLGRSTSRITVASSVPGSADPRAWEELRRSIEKWRTVEPVPLVADLGAAGVLGVAGEPARRAPVCRGLVLQLVGLHSPTDLVLAALLGPGSGPRWDWLKWLPHSRSDHSPLGCHLLTSDLGAAERLLDGLRAMLSERTATSGGPQHRPAVVLLVEDDCPVERSQLIRLAEAGPSLGLFLVWGADHLAQIPDSARVFIALTAGGTTRVGFVDQPGDARMVRAESVDRHQAETAARSLAPLIDVAAQDGQATEPPSSVGYRTVVGERFTDDPAGITERWRETDSIAALASPTRRRTALRALVGLTSTDPLVLDLIAHGPHALVAGTTGSGKSELLQTWVAALASDYSPDRLNFLFIDYKGGTAFASCLQLPHCTGLVTDLTPRLAARVLNSLRAELRRRERILRGAGANDLQALEQQALPEIPARLVIVVDEFAVLAKELPSFVDGIVDIAQRGRSLGLHLILATQRPAGVIGDNLRANTNLRIALRTTDRGDSIDVLGDDAAARFDPDVPGRAAVRFGSRPAVCFQTAYLGGCTAPAAVSDRLVRVQRFRLSGTGPGSGAEPGNRSAAVQHPPVGRDAQTDLQRLVSTIRQAAGSQSLRPLWRPWLPELPSELDLNRLMTPDGSGSVIRFAMADRPDAQQQTPVGFDPERAGHLLVIGTSGAGRSTALRTLAVAATISEDRGPTHIYGLDHGSRGLELIRELPNVGSVISGDDHERASRLLRMLRALVADRSSRFAERQASDLTEYRQNSRAVQSSGEDQNPGEETTPRVLLLLDGLADFRKAHEGTSTQHILEDLVSLAADGRSVGVHLVLATDRPGSVPAAMAANISTRLVLRLADQGDAAVLRLPRDAFSDDPPPGRGFLDGEEVQVAVPGGSGSLTEQARYISVLRRKLEARDPTPSATPIPLLPHDIDLLGLPVSVADRPTLGLEYESLLPIGFPSHGTFVVAGPAGSGRSTAIQTMIRSLSRSPEETEIVFLSGEPRDTGALPPWWSLGADPAQITRLTDRIREPESRPGSPKLLLIADDAPALVNGPADVPLQELVRSLRGSRHCLIVGGDTSSLQGSWPLLVALRASRQGLVLRPDPGDGELLFRTALPRSRRSDIPPGRGVLVADGHSRVVQVAR